MKFFLDTASLSEIEKATKLNVFDGITTNPSLMAKENIFSQDDILTRYKEICKAINGDISAEVLSENFEDIIKEGKKLASLHPQIVVKVPMTQDGIRAIKHFSQEGIRTNCTLVFSASQAIVAAKAGASYVSPFVGRLDDISCDGLRLIEEIKLIYSNYDFETEILAASIRHSMHVIECAKLAVDAVTAPLNVYESLFKHPLTEIGLRKFLSDINKKHT